MLNPSNTPTLPTIRFPRSTKLALLTLVLAGGNWSAPAQTVPPATAPGPAPIGSLRTPLANLQTSMVRLNIGRWKVPGDVREHTEQDAASIQRDLTTTLPRLMAEAEAPSSHAALLPAFAVFRNLDALYDVLLRVTETAALAGAGADASSLEDARAGLEDGRAKLGAWLVQAIGAQDEQNAHAAANVPPPAAATPPAASRIVVEDGPENPKPRKKKPTPIPAPQ